MVHTGDRFDVPIEVYDLMCPAIDKRFEYKIRRVPLGDREDDDEEIVGDIPVEPYYIGLHLGDGTAGTSCIASSEAPVRDHIYSYVDRINQTSPYHHEVIATLIDPAGAVLPDGYVAHVATWRYNIVVRGRRLVNVVKEGMRNLGIYTSKEGGIPREVMEGTTEQKLQCLAGLIDSDGTLRIDNSYVLTQLREEHRAIIYSAKALAESVGICVTGVYRFFRPNMSGRVTVHYTINLTAGAEKLDPYILIDKKRLDPEGTQHVDPDIRTFSATVDNVAIVRSIEVRGPSQSFQLANRLLVRCSH